MNSGRQVSQAEYRGVTITETAEGCTFCLGGQQYDVRDLSQAVAIIDEAYLTAEKRIIENKSLPIT